MGIVNNTYQFTENTETVTKTKLNNLAGPLVTEFNGNIDNDNIKANASIAGSKLDLAGTIVNADINASAAIADTKLATISTAGKVSGAALTSLASIPAGAGVIPAANVPVDTDATITTSDITTNNASTSKHGFLKKLSNVATEFMNGVGNWVAVTIDALLPSQTGNSGKFLTTNGSAASWGAVTSYTPSVKYGSFTRRAQDSNGSVNYTGVGFQPTSIEFYSIQKSNLDQTTGGWSSSGSHCLFYNAQGGGLATSSDYSIRIATTTANTYINTGVVSATGADGFTITWTRSGSAGSEDTIIFYIARK